MFLYKLGNKPLYYYNKTQINLEWASLIKGG